MIGTYDESFDDVTRNGKFLLSLKKSMASSSRLVGIANQNVSRVRTISREIFHSEN